jgi:hypothetical protein
MDFELMILKSELREPDDGLAACRCNLATEAAIDSRAITPGEITMSKFMILYRAPESVREQMANATPEQQQAGLEAWRAWATKVGYAIVDLGTPLGHTTHIGPGAAGRDGVCGYSILEAGSAEEVETLLVGNPQLTMPGGGSIDVFEIIPIGDI